MATGRRPLPLQRQRRAHRHPRARRRCRRRRRSRDSREDAGNASRLAAPAEWQADQRHVAPARSLGERRGEIGHADLLGAGRTVVRRRRGRYRFGSRGRALLRRQLLQQKRDDRIGIAHQRDVHRRQRLVIHAPAIVDVEVEGGLDHLGADTPAPATPASGCPRRRPNRGSAPRLPCARTPALPAAPAGPAARRGADDRWGTRPRS